MIRPRVTVPQILERKASSGSPRVTMITAYDATFASIVDDSGVDIILVGRRTDFLKISVSLRLVVLSAAIRSICG